MRSSGITVHARDLAVVEEKAPHLGVGPKTVEHVEILGRARPELEGFRSQPDRAHDIPPCE